MTASLTIFRDNEFIVSAADSCVSDANGNQIASQCKISPIGRFFYAANKCVGSVGGEYDLHQLIENVGTLETPKAMSAALKESIPGPLIKTLTEHRRTDPKTFSEIFSRDKRQAVGVTLFGSDWGKLCMIDLRFSILDLEAEKISLTIQQNRSPDKER